jgi:adrenodoxin-NADP+ reductase
MQRLLYRRFSVSSSLLSSPARVCIVGTGPGGFYAAKYLIKENPSILVDLIDSLPTPFGLVRSGVAPDHQDVKSVQNDFSAVATDPRVRFLGGVMLGRDLSIEELSRHYNAVVLAYGAASDRQLGVEGEGLDNVFSARAFVAWYNGHPDFATWRPNLDAEDVVIVGQGNVAIDCARILCKTGEELADSDIAAHAAEALAKSKVKRVHLIGRRGHVQASFTMKELREVTRLKDAACVLSLGELERGRTAASKAEIETHRAKKRMDALLQDVATAAQGGDGAVAGGKSRQLALRFLLAPLKIVPSKTHPNAVGAVEFNVTELSGEADNQAAKVTKTVESIPAGMVLKSIGYKSVALPGVPFDSKRSIVPNVAGRVVTPEKNSETVPGLYVSGWLKRGPSGIIGTNIPDARETVTSLLEDNAAAKLPKVGVADDLAGLPGVQALLASRGKASEDLVSSWSAYQNIDAKEVEKGKAAGKPREKFIRIADMLEASRSPPLK